MQKEIAKRFGIYGEILSLDVRPRMTNGMTPDIVADSRSLPFRDGSFGVILFDPPFSFHGVKSCGGSEYNRFYVTYGLNLYTSRVELGEYIRQSFAEIRRVLSEGGYCLFKWSESRIKLDWALALRGELRVAFQWQRPSKHWGTKTGTATWYVWLTKHGITPAVARFAATLTRSERTTLTPSTTAQADNASNSATPARP